MTFRSPQLPNWESRLLQDQTYRYLSCIQTLQRCHLPKLLDGKKPQNSLPRDHPLTFQPCPPLLHCYHVERLPSHIISNKCLFSLNPQLCAFLPEVELSLHFIVTFHLKYNPHMRCASTQKPSLRHPILQPQTPHLPC